MDTIWLVIPCYNEEEVIEQTASKLRNIINDLVNRKKISKQSRIAMVNDGSKDSTWKIIESLYRDDPIFVGINLSRNRGQQNALLAGLMTAKEYADAAISLDADLQDDINVIEKFIDEYNAGNDIVYGVRSSRKKDTFFKKSTAEGFYKLMNRLGVEIVFNHSDYRLMSKRCLNALEQYKEVNLFLRGIVPQIGFKSSIVTYERKERLAGESKYPLKKMISFATEGITSFSIKPIRFIANLGIVIFFMSICMLIYFLIRHLSGHTVAGWSSIVVSIWALGGLQLLSIGIVGEYVGKTYMETKSRPKYIIESLLYQEMEQKRSEDDLQELQ